MMTFLWLFPDAQEAAEVCQEWDPRLGPVCAGAHPGRRDGDRVCGLCGAPVCGRPA